MLDGWLNDLAATGIAETMRNALLGYPLVNAGHILGIALLVGAIVPLDLKLLGLFRRVPVAPLARVLVPVSMAGVVLALATGSLLFVVDPVNYAASTPFRMKLILVAVAIANALALRFAHSWRRALAGEGIAMRVRAAALLSLLAWPAALIAGRLIAFY